MAIAFTGSSGLFSRTGSLAARIRDANKNLGGGDISAGGLKSLGVGTDLIRGFYNSSLQYVVDQLYAVRDNARTSLDPLKAAMAVMAASTVVEQVNADVTLVSKDLTTALQEVITQMAGAGTIYAPDYYATANACTAGTPTANAANTGTGVLVASVVRPDGRTSEHVYAENLEAVCTTDAQPGGGANSGGTARQETFTLRGEVAAASLLAWDWPLGSGVSTTLTAIDCDQNANGNLLYNSNFDSAATTNTPDYWGSPLVGVYGTDILLEASTIYRSSGKSLRFKGDGSTLSSIAQVFGVTSPSTGSSGTSSSLKPSTVYLGNCWLRKTSGAAAGAVKIDLVNASNSNIADDAGTANAKITAVGALSSSAWTSVPFAFRTPKVLPNNGVGLKLRVSVSTAITNTESIYAADLALCEVPTPLYLGGPFVAIFAGATNFVYGDKVTCATTQDLAGDHQTWLWRMFNMPGLGGGVAQGLQLPSTPGGTLLNNNLVS
jgi:hypothetical protein